MKRNVGELKRVTEDYVKREVDRALDYYMTLYVSLKEKNHGAHGSRRMFSNSLWGKRTHDSTYSTILSLLFCSTQIF